MQFSPEGIPGRKESPLERINLGSAEQSFVGSTADLDQSRTVSAAEQRFLEQWEKVVPAERYGNLLVTWLRALEAYGTPSTFLDGLEFKLQTFHMLGMNYEGMTREGGNHELRRELIAKQVPYQTLSELDSLPFRIARSCVLCENVLQTIDSRDHAEIGSNLIFDLGDYVVTPNRYPGYPLHMLWLPKDHDDLSARVEKQIVAEGAAKVTKIPATEGLTRGALISVEALTALTEFCDKWDLVAVRNHPLSGMSISEHDHWHLIPKRCFPQGWFEEIAGEGADSSSQLIRAAHTPFDILIIKDQGRTQFVEKFTEVLNSLEHDNQVFSPTYVPGKQAFALVSALRGSEVGDTFVQIGGTCQSHEISPTNTKALELIERCAMKRLEFDWHRHTFDATLRIGVQYSKEEIHQIHTPIDYRCMSEWGRGTHVLERMSPLCRKMYEQTLHLQDKRDDPGHIDTVLHFTLKLAEYLKLPELEKEAAVLAAIFHDVGWASVPNINTIWNELATKFWSADPSAKAEAKGEMNRLRLFHQDVSAKSARDLIGSHPYLDQICAVVNDHDTRRLAHPDFFRAFFDGDWMWRVTRTSRLAQSSGQYDRSDYNAVRASLEREIKPSDFTLPWAYEIAQMELKNTLHHMAREQGWGESLPV